MRLSAGLTQRPSSSTSRCYSKPDGRENSANATATASVSPVFPSNGTTPRAANIARIPRERLPAAGRGQLPRTARLESGRRHRSDGYRRTYCKILIRPLLAFGCQIRIRQRQMVQPHISAKHTRRRACRAVQPVLKAHEIDPAAFSDSYIAAAAGMVKSRINFVSDLWDNARFFFCRTDRIRPQGREKRWSAEMPAIMTAGGTSCG